VIRLRAITTIIILESLWLPGTVRLTAAATTIMGTAMDITAMEAPAKPGMAAGPITADIPVNGILMTATTAIADQTMR
jgi:hypothetical protein